ncbi:MAG TPA: ABC transporter substrate-binding protein [Vicinamibacteria bacterium]|nr:ABC transporter substrate-binding protein [Vicinamibacteria bacterium]
MTVALVAGCRKAPPEPAAVATPLPPLRIGLSAPPLSFDPHLMNEFVTFEVLSNVMDGLVALDADLRVQPALAERWSSPDDHTWRFDIRKDVTFHDGRPFAATPAASWTRSSRRPPPPPRAWTSRTPSRPACAG